MLRVGLVALALVGGTALGVFVFRSYILPASQKPKANGELAAERSELEREERLDEARDAVELEEADQITASVPQLSMHDLEGRDYAQSVPLVQVSLQGSVDGPDLGTGVDSEVAEPATNETPGGTPMGGADVETVADQPASPAPSPDKEAEEQKTTVTPPKPPAEKPKTEPKQTEKPPQKPAEKPADKPAAKPGSGTQSIVVYVGAFESAEAAEAKQSDLSALGFSGSVTKFAGEYHIRVASFTEYDKARALSDRLISSGFNAFPVRVSK